MSRKPRKKKKPLARRPFFFLVLTFVFFISLAFLVIDTDKTKKNTTLPLPAAQEEIPAPPESPSLNLEKTPQIILSKESPMQGETILASLINTAEITRVSFKGQNLKTFNYNETSHVLIPLSASESVGSFDFTVETKNETLKKAITIKKRTYPLIDLGVPEELNMTEKEVTAQLVKQKESINQTAKESSSDILFSEAFEGPLVGALELSSVYGEIRKTGAETIRHLGIDLAGERGEPVLAINDGVVLDAYTDKVYGNSVILDHGASIISLYLHLDSITVKKGESIAKGKKVGRLGSTGYSTSPHLHLSIKINGVSVDPLNFISLWKN